MKMLDFYQAIDKRTLISDTVIERQAYNKPLLTAQFLETLLGEQF